MNLAKAPYPKKLIFKDSFFASLPIMIGYLLLGGAFGVLLGNAGYGVWHALIMGVCIYAGLMQFVAVSLLSQGLDFIALVALALVINARHIFYGISMLQRFQDYSTIKKFYMIFSLTDETFALLNLKTHPHNQKLFMFYISALNQFYWVVGGCVGALFAQSIQAQGFSTQGIEFVMNAIFIVIFLEQCKKNATLACIGAGIGIVSLCIFGADFLLYAMGICVVFFALFQRVFARKNANVSQPLDKDYSNNQKGIQ